MNFLFDYFGSYSEQDGSEICMEMITRVKLEAELYNKVGQTVLNLRGCDLDTWCDKMIDSNQLPDELMLFALSRTYNRHTMVLCKQYV